MINAALHLMAAVVLMGYLLFWALGLRSASGGASTDVLRRSQWLTWACLAILAVTGVLMLPHWHVTWNDIASGELFADRFGKMLGLKIVAILAMVAGFIFVRPAGSALWRIQVLAGLGVVFLSLLLVR